MTKKAPKAAAKAPTKPAAKAKAAVVAPPPAAGVVDKIGKAQLVADLQVRTDLSKAAAQQMLSDMLAVIVEAVQAGQTVNLPGLGTLSVKATAARTGVNPSTGAKLQIPAGKKVSFKPSATLKEAIKTS